MPIFETRFDKIKETHTIRIFLYAKTHFKTQGGVCTPKYDYTAIYREYVQSGLSIAALADKHGIARTTLFSHAKRHGWDRSSIQPVEVTEKKVKKAHKAKVKLDGDYFKKTMAVTELLLDKIYGIAQKAESAEEVWACANTLKLLQPTMATLDSHQVDMAKIKLAEAQLGIGGGETQPVLILPEVDDV